MSLTKWERLILEVVPELSASGLPPTMTEIGEAIGLRSWGILRQNIQSLEQKGLLRPRPKGRHRGVMLAQPLQPAA